VVIGEARWQPSAEARALAAALQRSLDRAEVAELIVFGSQARGGTTGFSDFDAMLVVHDEAAGDAEALGTLRQGVLAAQRAVLAHQPMQHHAFEVATPKLLSIAGDSLILPAVALSESRSLFGRPIEARFGRARDADGRARLAELVEITSQVRSWPRHPWVLHGIVSMFELLPALYLQARGRVVPKWRSFAEAREDFGAAWWPYDLLEQVRATWPRRPRPLLRATSSLVRNPWVTLAGWRRVPVRPIEPARSMLTAECLRALQELAEAMATRAR
jgi:hypothetical protein